MSAPCHGIDPNGIESSFKCWSKTQWKSATCPERIGFCVCVVLFLNTYVFPPVSYSRDLCVL